MVVTRRERLRRETLDAIADAALTQLATNGAGGLSLRAVAREVGMSPAGLYRYVEGRDDLLTQLIVSGYDSLADHLLVTVGATTDDLADPDRPPPAPAHAVAADTPAAVRLLALGATYRTWALAHPNHFALLFGDPVPGYEAPDSGITTQANTRVLRALQTPVVEAALASTLRPLPGTEAATLVDATGAIRRYLPPDVPDWLGGTLHLAWARIHGTVALELNGQFAYLGAGAGAALHDAMLQGLVADLGLA